MKRPDKDNKTASRSFPSRWVWPLLVILLLYLQARLWVGEGSLAETASLVDIIAGQSERNAGLLERNRKLELEVDNLKNGSEGIEERAREDMGMIGEGETFFLYLPDAGRDNAD